MAVVAIIGAMEEEVALIAASLDNVQQEHAASLNVAHGSLTASDGSEIEVAATVGGMGLVNAAATTQYLIDTYHPDAILFSGIAGNLNKNLHINDVVLGGTLRYLDTDMRLIAQWKPKTDDFHSDPRLLSVAEEVLQQLEINHIVGTIASGNYFVDTPEKTAAVIEATQADAVEMEGAAIAHVSARNDIPVLIIRALSDNADTDYEDFRHFDISEYANNAAHITVEITRRVPVAIEK
ncbi:MAG: 5'-methylthioadenosine/S-adenosylhomocysteine nucleosidase [Bifidobacteriaceae bacterium]|nr:5'-methylthioadenosine/S-adenosylhomocysteine nucleosidase [Bifidobacteriaceae bacterium]